MPNTHPLYTPTRSLDVKYSAIFEGKTINSFSVSGNEIHADLYRGNLDFHKQIEEIYSEKKLSGINTLTGVVTLIHSDAPVEEGYVANVETTTLYYAHPGVSEYIISTPKTFENRNEGPQKFKERLQNHINLSGAIGYKDKLDNNPIFDINQCSNRLSFTTTFHHTEQAYINSMYSIEAMNYLKRYVRRKNVETFFGMINDLNSLLPVCINCNIGLVGFQNTQENGYLATFEQHLQDYEDEPVVTFPDGGPYMHTRVSCTNPEGMRNQKTHQILTRSRTGSATRAPLILSNTTRNKIVQSYADIGDIHRLAHDGREAYRGDYFTSSNLTSVKKFEAAKQKERGHANRG